ncbi:MAG: hypothetical protein M1813_003458 [Trichoglossum hirsutum]|nr:MAG: hypothetical protein M1813_003458 [Trichoglossum hirsutum]
MSLPPEKVKIKRKKDDDPVEALYIASEDDDENPKKRRHTEFIFRRLQADDGIRMQNRLVSSGRVSGRGLKPEGAPRIHETLPGEVNSLDVQDDRSVLYKLLAEEQSKRISRDLPVRNKDPPGGSTAIGLQKPEIQKPQLSSITNDPAAPPKILQPRRFHLSKSSPVTPYPRSPVSGVQKRKKGALKNEVAIFIEKEKRTLRRPRSLLNLVTTAASLQLDSVQGDRRVSGMSREIKSMEGTGIPDPGVTLTPAPRKKPLISAQEKRRLAEQSRLVAAHQRHHPETQKTAQSIQADPSLWDCDSPELAAELQRFVLHSINTQTQPPATKSIKCKPKAPPIRPRDGEAAATAAAATGPSEPNNDDLDVAMQSSSDDEDNYVYDTYVREHCSIAPKLDPNSDGARVGVLVISPEDREEWEAFADDDGESDKDFNSDEEDENAESFYGNDYPEDELDPDDELGCAAYEQFRNRNASDDEEYGIWSGDEDELIKQHPWLARDHDGDEEMS